MSGHTYSEQILQMQVAWKNLPLQAMDTLDLTPEQWVAVASYKADHCSKDMLLQLPLPVARIRESSKQLLMNGPDDENFGQQKRAIQRDLRQIRSLITCACRYCCKKDYPPELYAGYFTKGMVPYLHADGANDDGTLRIALAFVSRIGALPFEAIRESVRANASPKLQKLIEQAKDRRRGSTARHKLRKLGVLEEQPLDVIYLLAKEMSMTHGGKEMNPAAPKGTLHCSGRITQATYSVFIRS